MNLTTYQRISQRGVALALAVLLACPAALLAQAPAAQNLRILTLVGNNGVNDMERQVMTPLAVQILDQNDVPVEGATVIFRFPINGASATFAESQTAQTVRTNANGQARATGWMANKQEGTFVVQVTATRGTDQGLSTVTMTNVMRVIPEKELPKKRWWTSKWAKIAYVAGAGAIAGGIVLKNRGGGPIVITGAPGAPTIGGPQ
jgi:hypothetical protein